MTDAWAEHGHKIAGGWKCISYEMFDTTNASGEKKIIAKPHGDNPLGRLTITSKGWLSAQLARPDRMHPLPSGKPFQTAPDNEVAHIARGLQSYCGYMKLFKDDQGGLYWQTKVEIATDPIGLGSIQERKVILEEIGGREYMILEPKQDMMLEDGTMCRAILKWEKFE